MPHRTDLPKRPTDATVLIGDIGGTNARFAVVGPNGPEGLATALTADFTTFEAAVEQVALAGRSVRPTMAVFAVAAPIAGERIDFTNSHWIVEPARLLTEAGFESVALLNDFEALALALPGLGAGHFRPLGGGRLRDDRPKLAVGPGTGLGAATLVPTPEGWLPLPSEAGHVDLAPRGAREDAIWERVADANGRVSAERLICGPGMVRLYQAVAALDGVEAAFTEAADISAAAAEGRDRQAVETLALFAACLGRHAGNLALTVLARGGVYLAGGMSLRLADALSASGFRAAFVDKAPHTALMEEIATVLITDAQPALAGLAALVRHPERFAIDLQGRIWRR